MGNELVIYADESIKEGKYFSNFYGGVLIRSRDLTTAVARLEECKREQNLLNEIKWQRVTGNYLEKYIAVMDSFFDLVGVDLAKVRVMFTNNQYVPLGLTREQRQTEYHRLYYQFIKHGFGLRHSPIELTPPIRVRVNFDQLPTDRESSERFKSFIEGLNRNPQLRAAGIKFDRQQIAEVDSRNHVLLQCLDIVLGSMAFRLNDKHKDKAPGERERGKRTVAKEKLYKHILRRIRQVYPRLNIGITTGLQGDPANRWRQPYRHWLLIPKTTPEISRKSRKNESPAFPMPYGVPQVELGPSRTPGLHDNYHVSEHGVKGK